jgi:heptosyltransferase I
MKRILIIKPSALGDVATTLPLVCDLKAASPEAQIDWLIHPAYAPLIEGHDAVHQVVLFDRKKLTAWWYRPAAFRLFWQLLGTLRQNRYDVVIDAQGLLRSGFLTWITGAKIRIGFAHAREGATQAYTHKVSLPEDGEQTLAVDRMRALGKPLGADGSKPAQFRIPVPELPVHYSAFKVQDSFIAVIPGARWPTKRWAVERFAALAERLLQEGHTLLLLGSPDEKSLCDALQQEIEHRTSNTANLHNLAGQSPIPTLIALLARARLVIANDTGPLHMAGALGRPVVALYGPTSPAFVGPYGQLGNVLRHDVPCHPCRLRTCDHHSCMQGLSVDVVWEKTARALATQPLAGHVKVPT